MTLMLRSLGHNPVRGWMASFNQPLPQVSRHPSPDALSVQEERREGGAERGRERGVNSSLAVPS